MAVVQTLPGIIEHDSFRVIGGLLLALEWIAFGVPCRCDSPSTGVAQIPFSRPPHLWRAQWRWRAMVDPRCLRLRTLLQRYGRYSSATCTRYSEIFEVQTKNPENGGDHEACSRLFTSIGMHRIALLTLPLPSCPACFLPHIARSPRVCHPAGLANELHPTQTPPCEELEICTGLIVCFPVCLEKGQAGECTEHIAQSL